MKKSTLKPNPFGQFPVCPVFPRVKAMTMEPHPQVFWARVTLGRVSAHRKTFTRKYAAKKELKNSCWKKNRSKFPAATPKKAQFIFWFPRGNNIQRRISLCFPFSSGCQFLGNTPFDWLPIVCEHCCHIIYTNDKVVEVICYDYLFHIVTIKACCTAAVESVHSVCAAHVVLTGMTCTIIDICFKVIRQKVNNSHIR